MPCTIEEYKTRPKSWPGTHVDTRWLIRTTLPHEFTGEDPIKKYFDRTVGPNNYACFNEYGTENKTEHQHLYVITKEPAKKASLAQTQSYLNYRR